MIRRAVSTVVVAVSMSVLSACAGQLPPADLVVLTGADVPAVAAMPAAATGIVVRMGEVRVPAYLDTYDVLVRSAPHQMAPLPDVKWAEKLPAALTRLMRENATAAGYVLADSADLVVLVDVDRFEPTEAGEVVLTARWTIVEDARQDRILGHGTQTFREPCSTAPDMRVDAMERAARRLADAVLNDLADAAVRYRGASGS